jgi:hypothetical protein
MDKYYFLEGLSDLERKGRDKNLKIISQFLMTFSLSHNFLSLFSLRLVRGDSKGKVRKRQGQGLKHLGFDRSSSNEKTQPHQNHNGSGAFMDKLCGPHPKKGVSLKFGRKQTIRNPHYYSTTIPQKSQSYFSFKD